MHILEYKVVEKEWSSTKKAIENSFRKVSKSVSAFKKIDKDIGQIVMKLDKLTVSGDTSIKAIAAEVDALTESTSAKYALAEASSEKMAKPSVTAGEI